jgi:hypothetical protein
VSCLVEKSEASVDAHFEPRTAARNTSLFADLAKLDALPVSDLMAALAIP